MFEPRIILHPTDYSDCANYAFEVAVDLARHHQSRLVVLHIEETLGPETLSVGEVTQARQPAAHLDRLRQELQRLRPPADSDILVEHVLAEGAPATAIAQAAATHQVDLVVMGTYGRTALSRLLTGSVTQKVAALTQCALLTVRMPTPPT